MLQVPANTNHSLNAICPYYTMFPLDFPLRILSELAKPGDVVIDPFCGRGTTNFACRLLGLESFGLDSSPVATAISAAKLANTGPEQVTEAADAILQSGQEPTDVPSGEFWEWAYHPDVLYRLCKLRTALLQESLQAEHLALRAVILGALHGPRNKSAPAYLSNQSQRTYAPKPKYAVHFWSARGLRPQYVEVRDVLVRRIQRYYSDLPRALGAIERVDSREFDYTSLNRRLRWIITSPPYWGMGTYLADQWLRLWFVGGEAAVNYKSEGQLGDANLNRFVVGLRAVWKSVAEACAPDATLIIRFGSINSKVTDPNAVTAESLKDTPWRMVASHSAGSSERGKRQAIHGQKGKAAAPLEEYDIWARLT